MRPVSQPVFVWIPFSPIRLYTLDPQMFFDVLEFVYSIHVPLTVMAVYLNVPENVISALLCISHKFWWYKLPMIF